MSERPNLVLASIVALGTMVAALLVAALAGLGSAGAVGLTSMVVGIVSACINYFAEFRRVPLAPGALVVLVFASTLVVLTLASALQFMRVALAYARQRRVLHCLPLEGIEDGDLVEAVRSAGVHRLFLTPGRRPAAFCFGLLRPRIVVTSGLLARLNREEQVAAVLHEAYHAREREPLRCFAGSLIARTFFWLPSIGDMLERYRLVKEIAADRLATDRTSTRALAGALSEVAGEATPAAAVGFAEFASTRIDRLFEPSAPLPSLWRPSRLLISVLGAAGLVLAVTYPARLDVAEMARLQTIFVASLHRPPVLAARAAFLVLAALVVRASRRRSARAASLRPSR